MIFVRSAIFGAIRTPSVRKQGFSVRRPYGPLSTGSVRVLVVFVRISGACVRLLVFMYAFLYGKWRFLYDFVFFLYHGFWHGVIGLQGYIVPIWCSSTSVEEKM